MPLTPLRGVAALRRRVWPHAVRSALTNRKTKMLLAEHFVFA